MTVILQLQGLDDKNEVLFYPGDAGKMRRGMRGSITTVPLIGLEDVEIKSRMFFGDKVRQPRYKIPPDARLIFNEITEPDSHGIALQRAVDFCERAGLPVINHPAAIRKWTRDGVARALRSVPNLAMPLTLRLQPSSPREVLEFAGESGIGYPFIFRVAGDHVGRSMALVRDVEDEGPLHRCAFDGRAFYLTEFVDARDEKGLYRKHRVVMVDGQPHLEDSLVNEYWNVHRDESRQYLAGHPELGRETDFLEALEDQLPRLTPTLGEIARIIDLDFFGIDFHVCPDGKLLIYEANANMNIGKLQPPELDPWVNRTRAALREMVEKRIEGQTGTG